MRRLAVLAVLILPLQAVPAYAAVGDPVTGWWARTRLGPPVPIEAPSPVPDGGTWVASDPGGPLAVSALRLVLEEGAVATGLKLEVDKVQGTPAVRVCPAVARWQPEQGGRLDNAPAHDCKVVVKAEVKAGALVATLPPGFAEGALDVVLTPEPGSSFSLTLKKAAAQSVTTTSPSTTTGPPMAAAPPPPGLTPAGTSAVPPPISTVAVPATAPLQAPAGAPLVAGPQVPAPAPIAAPAPKAAAAGVPAPRLRPRDDRREAVPAAVLLLLLAALALRLQLQPAAPPQRLGGGRGLRTGPVAPVVRSETLRGVGRFRGVRSGKPVRL